MDTRMLAMVAMVMIALAGCDAGGSHSGPSRSPSLNGHTVALDLARCMRANGQPTFPDPVQDAAGNWTLSAQDIAKLREYTTCMRNNGVPNFPDPTSDGDFPDMDQGSFDATSMGRADRECQKLLPASVLGPQGPKPSRT
jgi:hypothetical protein